MITTYPLQFGIPGGPELLVILLIAVLLFGANKIPKLARSTGEAMGEFQKGREEVEQELQEMRDGVQGTSTSGAEADSEPEIETAGDTGSEDDEHASDDEADDESVEEIAEAEVDSDSGADADTEVETDEEQN